MHERRTHCSEENCLESVNIKVACRVGRITEPIKMSEVPVILMKGNLQKRLFDVCRNGILVKVKTKEDQAEVIEKMWSSQ